MGKYEPLTRYLEAIDADSWETTFDGIEQVLGFKLPNSAYQHQAWWANQTGAGHTQTQGWQQAGYETKGLNLSSKQIRFERIGKPEPVGASNGNDLWRRASEASGITDRELLIEAGLTALINRETARYFASLGGTMADAAAPPRRRFE